MLRFNDDADGINVELDGSAFRRGGGGGAGGSYNAGQDSPSGSQHGASRYFFMRVSSGGDDASSSCGATASRRGHASPGAMLGPPSRNGSPLAVLSDFFTAPPPAHYSDNSASSHLSTSLRGLMDSIPAGRDSFVGSPAASNWLLNSASSVLSVAATDDPVRAMEKLMLSEPAIQARVLASLRGISSLAKETTAVQMERDATGATVINQYVVVKSLGHGTFGRVKLVLNTLDGQLYAVKMVLRRNLLLGGRRGSTSAGAGGGGGSGQALLRKRVVRSASSASASSASGTPAAAPESLTVPVATAGAASGAAAGAMLMPAGGPAPDDRPSALSNSPFATAVAAAAAAGSAAAAGGGGGVTSPSPPLPPPSPLPAGGSSSLDQQGAAAAAAEVSVRREIAAMKKMDHENVVKLFEVIDPPNSKCVYLRQRCAGSRRCTYSRVSRKPALFVPLSFSSSLGRLIKTSPLRRGCCPVYVLSDCLFDNCSSLLFSPLPPPGWAGHIPSQPSEHQ